MTERGPTLPDLLQRVSHPDFPWALECVFRTFNDLINVDARQSWRRILHDASRIIVEFLGAEAASIRIHEPHQNQMVSFGSYHYDESRRESAIPFDESIAGWVVSTGRSRVVPDIASDPDYRDKSVVAQGLRSLVAVPLIIPRFVAEAADVRGAIHIYYREAQRAFSPAEVLTAELMAQRVSYVIARKRIAELRRVNQKKEWVVEKIFAKLSLEGGIKMKEIFRMMVEELQDIIKVQSCTLFAVSDDGESAVLESGWPEEGGYHTIGKAFVLSEHPYLRVVVRGDRPFGDTDHERVHPSYLLIKSPQASGLVTENLRRFARAHNINSILYVPLRIGDRVSYVLVFDAVDKRRFFADEEIEILTFFGKQITQALEIERLDDILHDFKNPAIAVAGFARRVRRMLERGDERREEMLRFLDVIIQEGTRLQEMAVSLSPAAKPEALDFSEVVRARFLINEEAIREQKRVGIVLDARGMEEGLRVSTGRLALERVLDNLLNNATKAIPREGGKLEVRTGKAAGMAWAEITNSGQIPEAEISRILSADVSGRGLNIVYRFARSLGGLVEVRVDAEKDTTTFRISLPLLEEP
jgi:signal transduction histidine kinase